MAALEGGVRTSVTDCELQWISSLRRTFADEAARHHHKQLPAAFHQEPQPAAVSLEQEVQSMLSYHAPQPAANANNKLLSLEEEIQSMLSYYGCQSTVAALPPVLGAELQQQECHQQELATAPSLDALLAVLQDDWDHTVAGHAPAADVENARTATQCSVASESSCRRASESGCSSSSTDCSDTSFAWGWGPFTNAPALAPANSFQDFSSPQLQLHQRKVQSRRTRRQEREQPTCQVEGCHADLSCAKLYNRRYSLCAPCMKREAVMVGGAAQRFCQQCSTLHDLGHFEGKRRSCREKMNAHIARRRAKNAMRREHRKNNSRATEGLTGI